MKWKLTAAIAACALVYTLAILPQKSATSRAESAKTDPVKAGSARVSGRPTPLKSAEPGAVQTWMRGMTLRDRVGQLFVLPFYGENPSTRSKAYREFVRYVRDLRVGGLIVVGKVARGGARRADPYGMAAFTNRMQKLSKVPLLIAGDFERGASMRVDGTTKYPHLMAFGGTGDSRTSRDLGRLSAREARALGVHWLFAPDADVNNNPDNPIINVRSFGENPEEVGAHVRAFIEGAHSDPAHRVLVTVKHFPGHGDTNVDSHMNLPLLGVDRTRLEQVELVPFREAVDAGVDAVMTAHMAVPALEPSGVPATVSHSILTGVLRRQLGFRGLIVTDAMDMQGLTKQFGAGEAAVRAIEAGVDVLLMPARPDEAIKAVLAAVQNGRISRKRLDESVSRILAAKARVGLHRKKLVNIEAIGDELETAEGEEFAQTVADRAVTLVKNDNHLIPLRRPGSTLYVVLSESRRSSTGETFVEELRSRIPAANIVELDPTIPAAAIDRTIERAEQSESVVVAAFVSVGAYRGDVAMKGNFPRLMDGLLNIKTPVAMVAFGNPYLLRNYPGVAAYLATYSIVPVAETAAVKALIGEIPIQGRLPVSMPGLAAVGQGISLPATVAPVVTATPASVPETVGAAVDPHQF